MTTQHPHLLGMTLSQLEALLLELGEPASRARQLYQWVYAKRAAAFDEMTSFGRALRERLAEHAALRTLSTLDTQHSEDGTIKYLFRTQDNLNIEAVLIPS